MVHAGKDFFNTWIKIAVRVGDEAELHAFASSGSLSFSASSSRRPASFSAGDSDTVSFIAPTKSAVKRPPLRRVLRKNSHVCGQPPVPVVNALIKPSSVLVYSGLL